MKKILLSMFALALVFQTVALAEVVVGKGERVGKWYIALPGQKTVVVGPKESLPAIQDGSNVQVEGDNAQITTTGKSTVSLIESIPFTLSEKTTCIRTQGLGSEVTVEVSAGRMTVFKYDKPGIVKERLTMDAGTQVRLKDDNLDVIKGEAVLESSGGTKKFGAGKSLKGFAKGLPPGKA